MKELQPIFGTDQEGLNKYYGHEYDEPLLEYVKILAEKIRPLTEEDYYSGCAISKAIGIFVGRYFEGEIDMRNKDFEKDFEKEEIQEIIKVLGYDVDKFWYLTLFIYDFSYGYCFEGIERKLSPKNTIEEFTNMIMKNVKSYDDSKHPVVEFHDPIKIKLEIKNKHKYVIDDPDSIIDLVSMCLRELKKVDENSCLNQRWTSIGVENNKIKYDPQVASLQIWYIAKLFLQFFELKPPKKVKAPRDSGKSFGTRFLISNLISHFGLSKNDSFLVSDSSLKGFLKQYKNFNLEDLINIHYS